MVSEKQRAANYRNAQRSSGPKTEQGKRTASVNALRHGLTIPVDLSEWAVHLPQLQALLLTEGLQASEARELALRILDYERNLQHLQTVLKEDDHTRSSAPQAAKDFQSAAKLRGWAEDMALGFSRAERGLLRQLGKLIERSGTLQLQEAERQLHRADRHYRRAANQLLKSLRTLTF